MNALLPLFTTAAVGADHHAANVLAAARALTPQLNRSRALDRRLVANVMTTSFGGSDAEGAWLWRDAYDAIEAAMVLQLRRLGPQIGRLEDAPAEIVALLANLAELSLTHSRRSEEQLALDQFSTPPQLGALAVLAAQVRPGDQVLEPSAGTGLLAVLAEACGGQVSLNEVSAGRAGLLEGLFPLAPRTQHDAVHLKDLLAASGGFHVVLVNPPFQHLEAHLHAALDCLAEGGRMAAIVPARLFEDAPAMRKLAERGRVHLRLAFMDRAYAKHGTSVKTGLFVMDRGEADGVLPTVGDADTLADAAHVAAAVAARPTAQPRQFRAMNHAAVLVPRARALATPSNRLAFLATAAPLAYETCPWSGEGHDVGLYQAYTLGRVRLAHSAPHPSPLVESGPMASVPPPAPTYRPLLPPKMVSEGLASDAQLETVIYAGEAHAQVLPGSWILGEAPHQVVLIKDDHQGAVRFRKGFFVGDGTGCGKGREIAGVIADNIAQGRERAVWLSKNDPLLEDARRDWGSIGGAASDITPQSAWKQADAIRLDRGILYTTYATLRQPSRGDRPSRLDQMVTWLGADFDGVIVFDEAHAMANAAGGGKGARGTKKASQQGMAGLALQNRLPNARILYVSATGASTPENLAYAARLGLWGGPEAPFPTRDAFMDAVETGGVAVMELIARELKAMGLYVARSLSFEGVEYEPLHHPLTEGDIAIWDAWADAYQLIHRNLRAALEAVGISEDGKPKSGHAASAVMSVFEGAKLRFFGHLLAGLKSPSLVASIRDDLAAGRSAVVQVVSTNEAVMERRLAEIPPEEWNNLAVDLTPKDQVLDYLMGGFPVRAMDAVEDEDGNVTMVPVTDADGRAVESQEALRLREELVTNLACLPAVPGVLDAVIGTLGSDHVAEITGRSRRVITRDGRRVVERRSAGHPGPLPSGPCRSRRRPSAGGGAVMTRPGQPDLFAAGVAEASPKIFSPTRLRPPAFDPRLVDVDALDEAESLARLIARAWPTPADPTTVAEALLVRFGAIGHVLGAPQAELTRVVGPEVAAELVWLHALLVRSLQFPLRRREVLTSWDAVCTYLRARLTALPREVFHVLFLDTKNQLIADERLGEGTVNHAPVYPREVVRRALELSAHALVLAHNHPSGDPTPSRADIEMTQQVVEAAKALGIQVHDHIIIAGDAAVSLKRQGLM